MEKQKFRARWADLDPNFHMRHSVYSDYAADTRMAGLDAIGISKSMLMKLKIGPILFNEFIEYFKEKNYMLYSRSVLFGSEDFSLNFRIPIKELRLRYYQVVFDLKVQNIHLPSPDDYLDF